MLIKRGPICGIYNLDWSSTPGPTAMNDSADIDHPIKLLRSRTLHGVIARAEEGELILAAANLTSITKQEKIIILTTTKGAWYQWAKQFASYSKSRFMVKLTGKPNEKQILKAYKIAAKRAGTGGVLVINVGHGYSKGFSGGAVDLAPDNKLFLSMKHFGIKANKRLIFSKKDKKLFETFQNIGKYIRTYRVKKVLFLSCSVGGSHDFLQEIANEWQTIVGGYKPFLEVWKITIKNNTKYCVQFKKPILAGMTHKKLKELKCTHDYPTGFGKLWWVKP